MNKTVIPYAKQSIQEQDIQAVADALKNEIITRGSKVQEFESAIATYCGAQYAVAFSNGTTALMGAYFAANVSPHDKILSTPNTFIATVGAGIHFGVQPHFLDIDRRTGNLDLEQLKNHLNFRSTRGRLIVVPVHFAGIAVDMQALDRLICHPDTVVIEDAAHAIGSCYPNGKKVGCCAWSQMTVFSFHPAKTMTTGEGGMVLTNDQTLYHRLQLYRNNGIERDPPYLKNATETLPGYYEVQAITGNFHFTDFQAALGLSQLQRLENFIAKRRRLMRVYRNQLKQVPHIQLFTDEFDQRTAFHLCVVQIDFEAYDTTRVEVMKQLQMRGIGTQVHYIPLYKHPYFKGKKCSEESLPETDLYYSQALTLPLYYDLQEKEVKKVCQELIQILQKNK